MWKYSSFHCFYFFLLTFKKWIEVCSLFVFAPAYYAWYISCPFLLLSSRPLYTIGIDGGSKFIIIIFLLSRNIHLGILGFINHLLVRGNLIIGILIIFIYSSVAPFIWARVLYTFLLWFRWVVRWSIRFIHVILWCDFIVNNFIVYLHFVLCIFFVLLVNIITLQFIIHIFMCIFFVVQGRCLDFFIINAGTSQILICYIFIINGNTWRPFNINHLMVVVQYYPLSWILVCWWFPRSLVDKLPELAFVCHSPFLLFLVLFHIRRVC